MIENSYLWVEILAVVCLGLGLYIGNRGVSGIETDLATIKTDISNIKAKFDAPKVTVTPTPIVTHTATPVVATETTTKSG